jgi:hypothetical protein
MRLGARYVADGGNQVQYTKLFHVTVHGLMETLETMFSTQRCFMRHCARYVGDVGNHVQYLTLLHSTLDC